MTALTRVALKAAFETGDQPLGSDFVDLIDSCVNLQDTATQFFVSDIQTPGITVSTVSASTIYATNVVVAGSASVSAFAPSIVSAQVVIASAIEATTLITSPTVSAHVVRASAVHHKNPHALVYQRDSLGPHLITSASAYAVVSALLSGTSVAMRGFTENGSTTVTYTGATTAAMDVGYALGLTYNTAASPAAATLFKNGVEVPEARSTATMASGVSNVFAGNAIVKMTTSDTIDVRVKVSVASSYNLTIRSYNVTIVPVSWEF